MGTKVPKAVGDYSAFDLDLGVVCGSCGRVAVFQGFEVEAFFKARGVRTSLPVETRLFSCRCGSKDITTIGVPIANRPAPFSPRPDLHHELGTEAVMVWVSRRRERVSYPFSTLKLAEIRAS